MSNLYTLRAFGVINKTLDQIMDNVPALGEMSAKTKSYSTSKTRVVNTDVSTTTHLNVLSCTRDGINAPIPSGITDRMMLVHKTLVDTFRPEVDFRAQLEAYFPELVNIAIYGDFISYGSWLLPGYMEWEETVAGTRTVFKLWLGDSALRPPSQYAYDDYEIRVVPPVPSAAAMMSNIAVMQDALNRYKRSAYNADVMAVAGNGEDPETGREVLDLRWVDQETSAELEAGWTLILYGPNAFNRENQIEAIRNYLIDTTGRLPEEWVSLIPELDTTTELVIFPMWHQVAVGTSGTVPRIMSPVTHFRDWSNVLAVRGEEPSQFILDRTYYATSPFKSIGFLVHPEEISAAPRTFFELYPQYSVVEIGTVEINMLSTDSKEALVRIEEALRIAEVADATDSSGLTEGYHFEQEDNLTFLVYNVGGVIHRMVTRKSFLANPPIVPFTHS